MNAHNIIHLSDIHILNGNYTTSRYYEYISVFNNLFKSIKSHQCIKDGTAVIVVTGDLFNSKNSLHSCANKLGHYFLEGLSEIADVIVIRGNHDYRQDRPEDMDTITPFITNKSLPNVIYYDKTDVYKYKNIAFGLVAIQDALLYGATGGIKEELDNFPSPAKYPDAEYKLALFHGTITGVSFQNGLKAVGKRKGYPINWFNGYEAVLLGDIHLQQVHRAEPIDEKFDDIDSNPPYAYPGSLIQQNVGESIHGHGYILWNLSTKTLHTFHIHNSYGIAKVLYNPKLDNPLDNLQIMHRDSHNDKSYYTPISNTSSFKWFPTNLIDVRVEGFSTTVNIIPFVKEKLESIGFTIGFISDYNITQDAIEESNNSDNPVYIHDNKLDTDFSNVNSTENIIKYFEQTMTENGKAFDSQWHNWFSNPEQLIIPTNLLPKHIASDVESKTNTVRGYINEYTKWVEKSNTGFNIGTFHINKMEWSWILNFRDNNVYDFDISQGCISIINAKNGCGKSNFFETIYIALFGDGFESRKMSAYSSSIICNKTTGNKRPYTSLLFTLSGEQYLLERSFRNLSSSTVIDQINPKLYKIVDSDKIILHQEKKAINDWVNINICTPDEYLATIMLNQTSDNDFIKMTKSEQSDVLDTTLMLNHSAIIGLIHSGLKYYDDIKKSLKDYNTGLKQNKNKQSVDMNELKKEQDMLIDVSSKRKQLHSLWNMIPEKSLQQYSTVSQIDTHLSELFSNISKYTVNETKDELNKKQFAVKNMITQYENVIKEFQLFTELSFKDSTEDIELEQFPQTIKNIFSTIESHPFYKLQKNTVYSDISIIRNKLDTYSAYKTDSIASDLTQFVRDFDSWNKIQSSMFSNYSDSSIKISKLVEEINVCDLIISEYPNAEIELSNKLEQITIKFKITRSKFNKLIDKKPNTSSKDSKWMNTTASIIEKYGGLDALEIVNNNIIECSKQLPLLCSKLSDYTSYINEWSNIPFNPKCNVCKKQTWREKCELYNEELPKIKDSINTLKTNVGLDIDFNVDEYKQNEYDYYMNQLDKHSRVITKYLTDARQYHIENELHINYEKWNTSYINTKKTYDKHNNELDNVTSSMSELRQNYDKSVRSKKELSNEIERLQKLKTDYDTYMTEYTQRKTEYDLCKNKLEYIWYYSVFNYRSHIHSYLLIIRSKITELQVEYDSNTELIRKVTEKDSIMTTIKNTQKIRDVFDLWSEWKQMISEENRIKVRIAELNTLVSSQCDNANDELALMATQRHEILSYLNDMFSGYRKWLYMEHIVPIIARRINKVLSFICRDRTLEITAEWYQSKHNSKVTCTPLWFIKDGELPNIILEKASGFQKFIIGIAFRIVFHQIQLNRPRFDQIFIDEGFTSCDGDNLDRVPAFLKNLLNVFNSICLVSHLDSLKCTADQHIFIARKDGLSQIRHIVNDTYDESKQETDSKEDSKDVDENRKVIILPKSKKITKSKK
jgi:DNA repair exonuclease SbcCD ATPase subunit